MAEVGAEKGRKDWLGSTWLGSKSRHGSRMARADVARSGPGPDGDWGVPHLARQHWTRTVIMALSTILLIIVILLLLGAVPAWPHSRGWGYGPSGLLGVVLLVLIILLLMGRI